MADDERLLQLASVRSMHVIDASKWIGKGNAYWLEWDHVHEGNRSFTSVIDGLEWANWHRLVKPGSTSIDIGTHSGDTTIPIGLFSFDKASGRRGRVIGVEPNPVLHEIIDANCALNEHIAEFEVVKCAITVDDIDVVELADHGNANCNGGIIGDYAPELKAHLEGAAKTRYTTSGRRLETIVRDFMGGRPAHDLQFVKTDCEGYDKEILKSSKEILNQIKPALMVEWFDWFEGEDTQDLFKTIADIGYIALHPNTLELLTAASTKVSDIACVHRDKLNDINY